MKKKVAACSIASALVLAMLTGCSSEGTTSVSTSSTASGSSVTTSADTTESTDGEVTFTIGYSREPESLDPKDFNSSASMLAGYDCYDTLLNFSMEGSDLEPCLAESWEQVDDTTYTYKIREGVKFSNGDDLTMEDVLYSLERVKNENYSMSYLFENVESFEVDEDTWTLTVHLTQPDYTWKFVPATSPCTIIDKDVVEAEGADYGTLNGSCVGTGPYMLDTWTSGSEMTFVKNPYYWNDPDSLDVDRVVFEVIEDDTSRALAAQSGQLDYVYSLSSETLPTYESISDMTVYSHEGTTANFIDFNTQKAPFDDENARKAVAYCIDKTAITSLIGGEYATEQGAMILPRSMFLLDEDAWNEANDTWESYQQDYDKAAEALAASAYPDGFSFELYTTPSYKTACEAIESMIEESGLPITCSIVEIQNSEIYSVQYGYTVDEDGKRVYDALYGGWISDWLDPTGYMRNLMWSGSNYQGGANFAAYDNEEFDSYLDQSYLETDDAVRSEELLNAMQIIVDDCAYDPLYETQNTYVLSNDFEYEEGPNVFWNFTVANVHVKQ